MTLVLVEKGEAVHHPRIESVAGVAGDLAHDVKPILEPRKLAACGGWKDCYLTILALISVLRYCFAVESETRVSVV